MWLTDIMMILFAGALASLILDMGKKHYGNLRPVVVGTVSIVVLGVSICDVLLNWSATLTQAISIQPTQAELASLYILNKFSVFVLFTVLAVGLAVSFYSLKYLNPTENAGPFFGLMLVLIVSLVGIVTAGDLLELFLFWEGMSVAAYGLVAFNKKVTVSLEAALKYLFLAGTGSLVALFGISIVYILTGSIQLSNLAFLFQKDPQLGALGLAMLVMGFGVEAAIFPLHTWLPDAYSAAPTPVSAVLAGVVTETAVFALIKIISPTFTPIAEYVTPSLTITQTQPFAALGAVQSTLVVIAVLTMLIGNLGALGQGNIKRMLSYSSIAHVGYMLAALATFSTVGVVAILFHIWNHGLVKSSFFMLTGNKGKTLEDSDLTNVKGLFHQNKLTGGMFALSSLGMLGVPPFGTFWSELLIIQSLLATQSLTFYALAVVVVLNIVFSVGYFSKVVTSVAEKRSAPEATAAVPWSLTITPLLLLLLSLLTGFAPWLMLAKLS